MTPSLVSHPALEVGHLARHDHRAFDDPMVGLEQPLSERPELAQSIRRDGSGPIKTSELVRAREHDVASARQPR